MSSRRSSLEEAFAAMSDPARSDELIAERTLATAERHSQLARQLTLYAALPRSFNLGTLAALCGREIDDPELVEAMRALVSFSFVHERANAGYAVHDSVREPLLSWWQGSTSVEPRFEEGLLRLRSHFDAVYTHAKQAADQLSLVASLVRDTSPSRYREVSEAIHDALSRAAIDVFQTAVRSDADHGVDALGDLFVDMEGARHTQLCDLLVRAAAEESRNVPEHARQDHEAWVAYWNARLANRRAEPVTALEILDAIPQDVDLRLRTWICAERTSALLATVDFAGALASIDEEIAIHEAADVDPFNSSTPWSQKAAIYRQLWQPAPERDALVEALRRARAVSNVVQATAHSAALADTDRFLDDEQAAVSHLMLAFELARTAEGQPAGRQRICSRAAVESALEVLGSRSARMLAMFAEQHRQLLLPEGAEGRLDLLLGQASCLAYGGDRVRAAALLADATRLVRDQLPGHRWRVDSTYVELAEDLGESGRGCDVLNRMLADPHVRDDRWELFRGHGNGALCLLAAGRLDEALEQIRQARDQLAAIDHPRAEALSWAIEAEVLRRRGDISGAREALSRAGDEPARGFEGYRHEIAARVALDGGDTDLAVTSARAAMASATAAIGRAPAAKRTGLLVQCLTAAGRYGDATRTSGQLTGQLAELRAFVQFEPTEPMRLADQHAGRAVRILVTGYGTLAARVRSATEHMDEAINLDPDLGWFHVERAFLDLVVGRTKQAQKQFHEAAQRIEWADLRDAVEAVAARLAAESQS